MVVSVHMRIGESHLPKSPKRRRNYFLRMLWQGGANSRKHKTWAWAEGEEIKNFPGLDGNGQQMPFPSTGGIPALWWQGNYGV